MRSKLHLLGLSLVVSGLVAACSGSDPLVAPPLTASFAKGGPNNGGGGTDVPPAPAPTAEPTLSVTSPNTSVFVGQSVTVTVIATSESGNRNAPTVTVSGVPAGFAVLNLVVIDNPHGGGPGHTIATYAWTPTLDQIGLAASITVVATTSGGTTSAVIALAPVQDAPSAVSGLTATAAGDHIEARWTASTGGAGPITYVVTACYENANIRPIASTCDVVATTTATEALALPVANPAPTVKPAGGVATYFLVMITPRDANGTQGTPVSVDVR